MKCLDDFLTEHAKKPYAKKCMAISAILIILYMCFEIMMFFKREYAFIMEEALAGLGE